MSKFKVGDVACVVHYGVSKDGAYETGTIVECLGKVNNGLADGQYGYVGNEWLPAGLVLYLVQVGDRQVRWGEPSLMLEADVKTKQAEFEILFNEMKGELQEKSKQAGKAMNEFADLLKRCGIQMADDNGSLNGELARELSAPIFDGLGNCGWSSSSLVC